MNFKCNLRIKNYKKDDIGQAFERSQETDKIPTGIFYKADRPTYEEGLKQIERKPLIEHIISDVDINKSGNRIELRNIPENIDLLRCIVIFISEECPAKKIMISDQ